MHACLGFGRLGACAACCCCQRPGPLYTRVALTCLPACLPAACLPARLPACLPACREFPGAFAITPEDGEAYNAYNDSYARQQGVAAVPKPFTWM